MDKKTREIADELIEKFSAETEERNNELRTELRLQLNALAERIDRGYNVEVRTGELPESIDGEDSTLDADTQKAAETILEGQASIEYMNLSGIPVLRLEQPDDDGDEDEDASTTSGPAA